MVISLPAQLASITVHNAQGSEFDVVILPVLTQHYRMLFRNQDTSRRQTALRQLLRNFDHAV
ncbi:MAG: hypothetical protein GQ559_01425 [Desulfobulbaceae bacterium]|nr:hypothetical protein [Desulfobulbaceae bacterium]